MRAFIFVYKISKTINLFRFMQEYWIFYPNKCKIFLVDWSNMNSLHSSKTIELCNKLVSGSQTIQYQVRTLFKLCNFFEIPKNNNPKIKKTIEKFYSTLQQHASNDAEKLKLINKLAETLKQIKSKSCCVSLTNMLVQASLDGIVEFKMLIDTFLRIINSKSDNSTCCIHSLTQLIINNKIVCIKYYSIRKSNVY